MPFNLPEHNKFGCLCLANASVERALENNIIDLGDNIFAVCGPPFEMDDHWRDWLGSVKVENLARTSLALISHRESAHPEILDRENQALIEDVLSIFYSLLIIQVFHHDGGLVLSGANTGAGVAVRQVRDLEKHFRPNGAHVNRITTPTLRRAAGIARGLRQLYTPPGQNQRFRNGFNAYIRGFREYTGADRLHQFVRAVEAIVKPEIGRSEAQFVHRCQIFTGTSAAARAITRELYQLRSQAEHMNPFDAVLANYSLDDRERVALQRAYQSQLLASDVYDRMASNQGLHALFDSDDHIDGFWRLPAHEQRAMWGKPIDLEKLTRAGLENPL